jgi:xylan 1,4-beta-xylosidase
MTPPLFLDCLRLLIYGGSNMSKKPVWIEDPHIFKKDGWY